MRDGSGLSRHDYIAPRAVVRLLTVMQAHPAFGAFYASLPVAGVDGTIARRMRGTPAEGNVRAKTGIRGQGPLPVGIREHRRRTPARLLDPVQQLGGPGARGGTRAGCDRRVPRRGAHAGPARGDAAVTMFPDGRPTTHAVLTVEQALAAILARVRPTAVIDVPLEHATGFALGADIASAITLPPWANAGMDGYAVRRADVRGASPSAPVSLRVVGTIAAGSTSRPEITAGCCARIMTGAPLPPGADAVVRIEDTDRGVETVQITGDRDALSPQGNVRPAGEDVQAGDRVAARGDVVTPALLGVLASVGRAVLPVHRAPRVVDRVERQRARGRRGVRAGARRTRDRVVEQLHAAGPTARARCRGARAAAAPRRSGDHARRHRSRAGAGVRPARHHRRCVGGRLRPHARV